MAKKKEKYTDPELRERIQEDIKASGKGGKPGQWSARKSQLLVNEFEKAGGYKGEKDEDQKHLEQWTEEEWQIREGEARAREGGETKRYLPKEAWERLSPEEREATEEKKREGSKKGEQYVENTDAAKEARKEAAGGGQPIEGYDEMNVEEAKDALESLSERPPEDPVLRRGVQGPQDSPRTSGPEDRRRSLTHPGRTPNDLDNPPG